MEPVSMWKIRGLFIARLLQADRSSPLVSLPLPFSPFVVIGKRWLSLVTVTLTVTFDGLSWLSERLYTYHWNASEAHPHLSCWLTRKL